MANSIIAQISQQGASYEEFPAAAAIEPGQGLELVVNSGVVEVQPISTADAPGHRVAREQRNPPRNESGNPVDQAYNTGDNVETVVFKRASEARPRLAAGGDLTTASNATVAVGDELSWFSDGTLYKGSNPVFVAREALDNSGAAAGENPLIRVEAL